MDSVLSLFDPNQSAADDGAWLYKADDGTLLPIWIGPDSGLKKNCQAGIDCFGRIFIRRPAALDRLSGSAVDRLVKRVIDRCGGAGSEALRRLSAGILQRQVGASASSSWPKARQSRVVCPIAKGAYLEIQIEETFDGRLSRPVKFAGDGRLHVRVPPGAAPSRAELIRAVHDSAAGCGSAAQLILRASANRRLPVADGTKTLRTMSDGGWIYMMPDGLEVPVLVQENKRLKNKIQATLVNGFVLLGYSAGARPSFRNVQNLLASFLGRLPNLPKLLSKGAEKANFCDGAELLWRGTQARLRLNMVRDAVLERPGEQTAVWLSCPKDAPQALIQQRLRRLFFNEAERVIAPCYERMALRAPKLPSAHWSVSRAERRWGVCTAAGEVRFSWMLVFCSDAEIEYVCAHELAHLVHFNHSKAFWNCVKTIDPEMEARRASLKARTEAGLPLLSR